jgi:hypothetical protein
VAVGTLTHADLQRTVKTERLYPVSPTTQPVTHEHNLLRWMRLDLSVLKPVRFFRYVGVSIERYEEPGSGGIAGLRVYSGDGKEPQVQSLSSEG